jgi:deoxycytidylate deaminase
MQCSMDKFGDMLDSLKRMAMRSCLQQKHGACLFRGTKVYAYGLNKYFHVNLPDEQTIPITVHAEIDVLSNVHSKHVKGMDILIIRVNKAQKLVYSRPCNACVKKMQQKGVRKAYYSTKDGEITYEFVDVMPKIHDSSGTRNRGTCQHNF